MSNVIQFPSKTPDEEWQGQTRWSGDARCMKCGHEWRAEQVQPEGITPIYMECPACHLHFGLFKYPFGPSQDEEYRVCSCGNDLFILTHQGHLCPNCGEYQTYEDDE